IAFHSVIYGGQPSTLIQTSPSDEPGCLTDELARKYNVSYAPPVWGEVGWEGVPNGSGGWEHGPDNGLCYTSNMSDPDCPYYTHLERFHVMSRLTGGYFYAIRRPCDMS